MQSQHWSNEQWKSTMAKGGGNKKKFQYRTDHSGEILYLRALQGHSGRNLIPGTDLRPADILTSALSNAYTALDVSICSPHACEAGADCTLSRVQAKHQHYGPHLDSLLRQNISYCPVVWSAYGRPHPDTFGRFALPQQIHCAQTQRRLGRGCLSQAALQHHS